MRAGASARRLTLRATLGARPRNAPEAGRAGPAPGLVSLSAARYGTKVIRFCRPGATGEPALKYATRASRSLTPMSGAVPAVKRVKPSPPAARKLFIVTRYEAAMSTGVPLIVRFETFDSAGALAVHVYLRLSEICRTLRVVACCSRIALSCAPV